ncbi:MAG: energy-coupling factor ABC transporter permease [Archaeoglobaceae archaeon]
MHIPDGYLDIYLVLTMYLLSATVVALSIFRTKTLSQKFGIVAAAIFVAQMLNWPIPGGTSAHFVGGSLAAILLGPYAGCVAMSVVLIVQCLVFNDGGITALGANIWNMAVVNVFVGYFVYKSFEKYGKELAAFLAGWLGITLAAIFAGLEIGLSANFIYGVSITVPIMAVWHAALGVIEGIITAAVLRAVYPSISTEVSKISKKSLLAIILMILVSPIFAYSAELVGYTEPLEKAAENLGLEENPLYSGVLPDYVVPNLDPYLSVLISATLGTFIVFGLGYILNARTNRKNA